MIDREIEIEIIEIIQDSIVPGKRGFLNADALITDFADLLSKHCEGKGFDSKAFVQACQEPNIGPA